MCNVPAARPDSSAKMAYVIRSQGDLDGDGNINAFDIEPFLDLLFGQNPDPCNTCTGDANADGDINAFDIEPFLNCLFP